MFGRIEKLTAVPRQRAALASVLIEGTRAMPGCLSDVVATDSSNENALWVTEVWDSQAPLSLLAIQKGRGLIAGMNHRVETEPLGGHGL